MNIVLCDVITRLRKSLPKDSEIFVSFIDGDYIIVVEMTILWTIQEAIEWLEENDE